MIGAISGNTWTEIIVALSIVVPVVIAAALTIVILRGQKDDPDEQRWRRLAEQRKDAEPDER
ncbi:MAG TPA: hypothetical protein VMU73_01545 [Gaiellaceae bacterium]|nr:hypothetical protein [Gaiellaceae bacterium]